MPGAEGKLSQALNKKFLFCFAGFGAEKGRTAKGMRGSSRAAGERTAMATKQAKKKATRKTAQRRETLLERKARATKTAAKAKEAGSGEARKKTGATKRAVKLDKKKLGAMVDRMLLQLAEQVEEGECKISTSEGVRLIQLRESLGLEKPSSVKVEWVEPKGE